VTGIRRMIVSVFLIYAQYKRKAFVPRESFGKLKAKEVRIDDILP